jgi:hypothetical protein
MGDGWGHRVNVVPPHEATKRLLIGTWSFFLDVKDVLSSLAQDMY